MGRLHAFSPDATDATGAADTDRADLFDVDVLVIGAGVAGAQAARAAAALGARVLVVDRCASPCAPALQSPSALRGVAPTAGALRARAVLWLNGHSALELLVDTRGAVRGAAGIAVDAAASGLSVVGGGSGAGATARPAARPERPWRVQAAAVVLATDDGLLMAVEAGAQLVGMDQQGGLRLNGGAGATTVPGLYAAGSAAWQGEEPGLSLPANTPARTLLSGQLAGSAAAAEAARHGPVPDQPALLPAGRVGLRGPGSHRISPQATCAVLQAVLGPAAQASNPGLTAAALLRLDALWHFLRSAAPAPLGAQGATREAAGRLAVARWRLRTLLARQHGAPALQPIVSGGLDEVWAETEASVWPLSPANSDDAADFAGGVTLLHERAPLRRPAPRLMAFAR